MTETRTGSSASRDPDDAEDDPVDTGGSETEPVTTEETATDSESPISVTRRGALGLLALIGGGTYAASDTASARSAEGHLTETWSGDPGTPGLTVDVGSNTDRAYVGATADPEGIAIQGVAHDTSGSNKGIEGKTKSADGIGLLGNAVSTSGGAKGLEGRSAAKFGTGVIGVAKHESGKTKGVRGLAKSPEGKGVQGVNTATSGTTYGVYGQVESSDGYGLYTEDDARVDGALTVGAGIESDPVVIGDGASAAGTATVVGVGSVAPSDSVVVGDGTDASGNDGSVIIGQSNTPGGSGEVVIGYSNNGASSAVTIGKNASNNRRSVAIGHNSSGANRNSVAIGAYANENASATDQGWPGIRVAIGSRASAGMRGTALGPGAGEWGSPGSHAVHIGPETSTSADYSIAIGDQREIGGASDTPEPMIKSGASGAVALGTSVEVGTAQVARIGTSAASNPSPRQLVWQGAEQLADGDYLPEEVTLFIDESNNEFVIKGKDSGGTIREARLSWASN